MKCAVGRCKESNSKTTNVSFYNFPKNAIQRQQWINFCNRVKPVNAKNEKICALHFKQQDFERNLKFEMGFSNRSTLKLKPGAVPSIHSSSVENRLKIPNETQSKIQNATANQIEMSFKAENHNIYEEKCVEENTSMTSARSDYDYIKSLEMEIDALGQENQALKMSRSESNLTINGLSYQIQNLNLANVNLEKALRRLFSKGQIKKIKNSDKRQNFTKADIAQAITLYSSSPKAYRFLRKKNFPLPSVRTLQRWSLKIDMSTDVFWGAAMKLLTPPNQMSESEKLCVLMK